LDLTQDFDLQADLNFGSHDVPGSDGIWVALVPVSAGTNHGYQGFKPSMAIEFDTFCNPWEPCYVGASGWNLSADHIALTFNGSLSHDPGLPLVTFPNIEDNLLWRPRIRWRAADHTLDVTVRDPNGNWKPAFTYSQDFAASPLGSTRVYYGFVGMTSAGSDFNIEYVVP